jgi:hypothetical protein
MSRKDFPLDVKLTNSDWELYKREILEYAGIVELKDGDRINISNCDIAYVNYRTISCYVVSKWKIYDKNKKKLPINEQSFSIEMIDILKYHNKNK